ncbi:cellulase family glycosylhydrolase [Vibrio sp. SCSIO 43136]|uniref:cellulase family glycosylhydrolase n=1 Tax=Vibrio sp. SCSIO 43136 TaxID=2819101 RepID=UPI0020758077|nr:cellulase family glycosylhydrolase [Vibrio sp. SCSIO 43136]USD67384.1 cellulase family glycosylhydrolase [Vibrio sp. SCSIO 43136]
MLKRTLVISTISLAITACMDSSKETMSGDISPTFRGNGTSAATIRYQDKDVYLNGVNVAWLNFASDFGNGLDVSKTNQLLDQVKASGGNAVRWWTHTNGTMSPVWNASVDAVADASAQAQIIADIKQALDIAAGKDMYIMLNLWSFDMLAITQYGVNNVIGANYALLTDQAMRESYITNFLNPLLDSIAGHPALIGIDLFNEPENMTESWFLDRESLASQYHVTLNDIHTTTAVLSAAIHDYAKDLGQEVLVTTGPKSIGLYNADGFGGTNYYSDAQMINLGGASAPLDYYAPHYYDDMGKQGAWSPFYHYASYWELDKPVVVAEFFADNDAYKPASFNYYNDPIEEAELCVRLKNYQYAGAFSWQWGHDTYRQSTLNCVAAAAGNDQQEPSATLSFEDAAHLVQVNVNSETGSTSAMSQSSDQAQAGSQSLKIDLDEPTGEKKVYVTFATDAVAQVSKLDVWVYYPQSLADAGVNGGKLFAKDGNWNWSEGPWVNITPGQWTLVSWTPSQPMTQLNELGFQLYGDASGSDLNTSFYIDSVTIGD